MMIKKPVAIVLGGTNPHIALIENLKGRGYYTVLLDYLENPPAKIYSDEHIRESTLDMDKVCAIAKKLNASLVISTCIDQANATACYVAEKLGLPKPYNYETAINVTDKGIMKKLMLENNIPTSRHISLNNFADFDPYQWNFPLVVKPSDSTGSKGVRKAYTVNELSDYFELACNVSRNKKVIIEEYIEGMEVQIDCLIQNNNARIIMIRRKNQMKLFGNFTMQSIGSSIPAEISPTAYENIETIANKIASTFQISNSSLFIQAIIEKNDKINVIEFAPRVGGGLSYRLINLYTGFDFLSATVDSFLNIIPTIKIKKSNSYIESVIIYANEGVFDKVIGQQLLFEENIIEEFFEFVTHGMKIESDMSTRSRIGAFIVKANTKKELYNKILRAIDILQVFDINGSSIMRKDIYNNYYKKIS
jgi:biotin carboxylase